MADSEPSGRAAKGAAPPPATHHTSSPTAVDNSTDVTPTRRARRRAERKAEAKGTPRNEQQKEEEKKEDEEKEKKEEEVKREEEEKKEEEALPDSSVTPSGWGYWGSWGKTILSTATATVTTVGQGLTQVLEKAETSLGIPSPTDLCVEEHKQFVSEGGSEDDEASGGASSVGGAMGMLSSLTSVVHSTGRTVIGGGLDALEFIGKKTMDVIAEGDPGFKKTKGLMNRNATLSQVLREAKEREQQLHTEECSSAHRKLLAHYGTIFDEFQGLSHLEALEILSRESEAKVSSVLNTLSGEQQQELRHQMDSMKDAFTLIEFDEEEVDERGDDDGSQFEEELLRAVEGLSVSAAALKLSMACRGACTHICSITDSEAEGGDEEPSVEEVHVAAIRSLAELTARSIQLFHKLAESALSCGGCTEPSVLSQLTVLLCQEVSRLSRRFTSCLTAAGAQEKADVLNPLITAIFLEASNSASYIQDAFQLLLPVLQISHIQSRATA